MTPIRSLLVANRGEIALRIMRTARRLGIRVIAVYSDADAQAPHVLFADDAVRIGPGPAAESYLLAERILEAARTSGANAIHPGYGFLSENAAFARKVQEAGLIFVGPPADAIDAMGDKAESKRRMIAAGVPCVPGYEDADQSDERFHAAAQEIGFPVMVKASAGGGGRGMRLVNAPEELETGLRLARSEALSAFGSDILILEKAILQPRHIEIQIFSDQAGNTVHMGERDCSVQRRHQKVIEESPSPAVSPEMRDAMGQAAIEAARAINYVGAGTVEFLTDASGEFYFLEMNTRLQVEHPVTEMVTGLDLVALQIEVAQGAPLNMTQEDITLSGHAIEARLYAEDPGQDFRPATGKIALWSPASGEGVRVDGGIASGQQVSPFYDPMLAKIIAWGENREIARRRLIAALEGSPLLGVTSNKRFLTQILERPAFSEGRATTAFISEEFTQADLDAPAPDARALAVAAVLFYRGECDAALAASPGISEKLLNWSSTGNMHTVIEFGDAEQDHAVTVTPSGAQCYAAKVGEIEIAIAIHGTSIWINGRNGGVFWVRDHNDVYLELDGNNHCFTRLSRLAAEDASGSAGDVRAPMHGVLTELHVKHGQSVQAGDRLAVLEAMKLQHEIRAEIAGSVSAIMATIGNQIGAGDLILEIEAVDGND
ncbi:acetyl/propionyl/methylcrotonyl-CoA carboxylase subunit alpha [Sedimentitalea nanhaiensis]|uniref:Geranyl-CoA carboxylase alpha subunit n=1 Tax=Sedimentitalea nanhaiensis TaxID=999627 RepID=A0A1I7DFL2_9RHOB|nr:acetyl-CoA carboxylase biotin carboxylase subunit [Sedimentitalea nanhaiensis]SFU10480.1 geranyl-CoA carboxylase alpha subunit [Sedimentitalea nanhaiensis]